MGQARRRAGLLRVGRTSKAPRGVERVVRKVQRKLERGGGLWHYSACSNAFRVRFVAFKRTLATRTRWGGLRRANSGAIKRYRAPTAPSNDRARSSRKFAATCSNGQNGPHSSRSRPTEARMAFHQHTVESIHVRSKIPVENLGREFGKTSWDPPAGFSHQKPAGECVLVFRILRFQRRFLFIK